MVAIVMFIELEVAFDAFSWKIFTNKQTVLDILVTVPCSYLYVNFSKSFIFGDLLSHGHLIFIVGHNLNFCIERTIYYL